MNLKASESMTSAERIAFYDCEENRKFYQYGTAGGWKKYKRNPVLGGGKIGTCFDVSLLLENDDHGQPLFKMWFSWRTRKAIGYTESRDGISWKTPVEVLHATEKSEWEANEVNRPSVIYHKGIYRMWYSGQMNPYMENGRSSIGLAESEDGICWKKRELPVIEPDQKWELQAVMCPHALYDEEDALFKMWYAAGCNHEPDSIGYAESKDGIKWKKCPGNPILKADAGNLWEQHKVVAPCVIKEKGWFYMFYVGHLHEERAQIGLARSRDGISNWEKHPDNPLICPDDGAWDSVAIYKPFVMKVGDRWMMWYNGAQYKETIWVEEQIGVANLNHENLF
mgnify:CR=1 FL=1